MRSLLHTLRVKQEGLLTIGHPCSSFVWVNRATSKRSDANPEGNTDLDYVVEANCMAMLSSFLCLVALARAVFFEVEQPHSSKLFKLDTMHFLRSLCDACYVPFHYNFLWFGCTHVICCLESDLEFEMICN